MEKEAVFILSENNSLIRHMRDRSSQSTYKQHNIYLYIKHICHSDTMRTTIEIRDDMYYRIIQEFGKRNISVTINEILSRHFKKKRKNMFGIDPWLKKIKMDDLRDEDDRNT